MCDSGVFVAKLWAERERERERERGKERGRERQREGDGEEEGEVEEEQGAMILWALGGNLCLAF